MFPQEFEPPPIDLINYNVYLRLPRKSDVWHRFEIRRSPPGMISQANFRIDWNNMPSKGEYFFVESYMVGIKLTTPDCKVPTQEDIEQFIYEYGELNIIFHNPVTNEIYRFDLAEADGIRNDGPLSVLRDKIPVYLTWDLPINRPKQPIFENLQSPE